MCVCVPLDAHCASHSAHDNTLYTVLCTVYCHAHCASSSTHTHIQCTSYTIRGTLCTVRGNILHFNIVYTSHRDILTIANTPIITLYQ